MTVAPPDPQDTSLGWLPALSLVRAVLGVAAGVMIATGAAWAIEAAFVCLAVAVVADLADGTLPHRLGRSSQMAAFLDHTADTVIFAAVFVGLLAAGWMSVWAVLVVAAAEVTVPYLRNIGGQAARALEIGWPERLRTLAYAAGQLVIVAFGAGLMSSTIRLESIGWVLAAVAALFWAGTLLECLRAAHPESRPKSGSEAGPESR